jgi:iron complex transport system substrate-binding protein
MIALAAIAAARILSADFCADQYVLALAEPADIAALSPDADKDFSYLRAKATGLPQARADIESVIARKADIVVRFWGGDAARLERSGAHVVTLPYAADFDAVKSTIASVAELVGADAKAGALIADLDRRIAALAARGQAGVAATYVTPGGVTAGKGTMIDAIFTAAGVANSAAEKGLSYWPELSAEALIADPPDFIVTGFFSATSERINHWSIARHPALKRLIEARPRVDLDADVVSCPAWFALDAAEAIRDAADAHETRR